MLDGRDAELSVRRAAARVLIHCAQLPGNIIENQIKSRYVAVEIALIL